MDRENGAILGYQPCPLPISLSVYNSMLLRLCRIKRTFAKPRVRSIRQRSSLPAAALRPNRRDSTADRQAIHGLLPVADVLSATLRAVCGIPAGLRDASGSDDLRLPLFLDGYITPDEQFMFLNNLVFPV